MKLVDKIYINKQKKQNNNSNNSLILYNNYAFDYKCSQCSFFMMCYNTHKERVEFRDQTACVGFIANDDNNPF